MSWSQSDTNDLKNPEFDRATIADKQAASEDRNSAVKPTLSKADPSGCLSMSVFDLDKTIVTDNCSLGFCRYLVKMNVLPRSSLLYSLFYYIRHTFFGLSLAQLHKEVFDHLLKGHSLTMIETYVEPFLKEYLYSKIYPPVLASLKLAQHLGHYTLILSNSPSFLVEKVAKLLGVNEWHATHYAVDKERNLCHIASIMQGEEKASYVKEISNKMAIEKEMITAYSDSFLDLPLLMEAGTPIAVNPDRKLRRFSLEHQWSIL